MSGQKCCFLTGEKFLLLLFYFATKDCFRLFDYCIVHSDNYLDKKLSHSTGFSFNYVSLFDTKLVIH